MMRLKWLLAVLFLLPLAFAQTSDETVGVMPARGYAFDGPGIGTVTQVDPTGSVMKSGWTSAGGIAQSVTTPRKQGENAEQQAWRHKYAVDALKAVYPPVPAEG